MSVKSRILFCKFCKSLTKFALSCFCLRLDSQLDNWFRELHGLEDYWMLLITDCITSCGEFESDSCSNITGVNLIKLHTLVSMHLKDTANTLFFALCRVIYIGSGIHCS